MLLNELRYFNILFIVGLFFNFLMSQLFNQPFIPEKTYTQDLLSYLSEYIYFLFPYITSLLIRLCQYLVKKLIRIRYVLSFYVVIILTLFTLFGVYSYISTRIQIQKLQNWDTAIRDEIFYLSQKDAVEDLNRNKHYIYMYIPDSLSHIIQPIAARYRFRITWPENLYMLINIYGYNKIVIEYMKYENGFYWEYKFLEEVEKELYDHNIYHKKILLDFKRTFEIDDY